MPSNNNINFRINYEKGDTSALDSLKRELNELKAMTTNLDMGFSSEDIQKLLPAISALESALNGAFDVDLNTINVQKFNKILAESGMNAQKLQEGLAVAGAEGNSAFLKMTAQLMQFNTATKQTNQFLDKLATSFFNTIRWGAMSSLLNTVTSTIQNAYYYVKDLDRGLNDIRIVTGKNADEMERFAESASDAAKSLAVTTEDYTQGSLIYYQQGLNDETVKTLTDITAKTSNVTQQSMSTVSEQLTAVWNGYKVANQAAEEGMGVYEEYVDKMAAVGAATASDLEELSTAMSKVASAASAMGVSFDDLNAQIATIVSVTRQAPESVGTALKTIYARLGDLKVDGVDEFGTKLGEVSTQLQTMGIQILDTNGDMRDMTDVMAEVAAKWDTWTSAQRQAAAVAMAGKRQYNNLVALFDNWDMYGDALKTSMEAAGTLEKQQEIALDSLSNKMDQLKATAEDLYDSLIDENSIKTLVTGLTKIVQLMADFADATGGLNNLLPLLLATATRVFNKQIAEGLSTIVINACNAKTELQTMEQNAAAVQAMFSNSSLFEYSSNDQLSDARIKGFEKLRDYYGDMIQYQSIMTRQEKEEYNTVLNLIASEGELNGEIIEQTNSWAQNYNILGLINKEIFIEGKNVEKISADILKVKNLASELQTKINSFSTGKIDFSSYLYNNADALGINTTQVRKLEKEFNTLAGDQSPKEIRNAIEQIIKKLQDLGAKSEYIQTLRNKMQMAGESAEQLKNNLQEGLSTKQHIANITSLIGTIGQLSMGMMTLNNLFDVWANKDNSVGDKLLQTFMNLGMVIPMLISSFSNLNKILISSKEIQQALSEVEKADQLIKEASIARTKAEAAAETIAADADELHTAACIKETAALEAGNLVKQKRILLGKDGILVQAKETAAILLHQKAVEAETSAEVVNLAIKNLLIAAILAIAAAALITTKAIQKWHEVEIEEGKTALEDVKTKQEQIKANEDLAKSYENLYNTYKETTNNTKELQDAAIAVAEAYDIQGARVLALAGNYEELNRQLKAAKDQELQETISNAKLGAESAGQVIAHEMSKGRGSTALAPTGTYRRGMTTGSGAYGGVAYGHEFTSMQDQFQYVSYTDPKEMKAYIDAINEDIEYISNLSDEERKKYDYFYKQLLDERSQFAEYADELETQLDTQYAAQIEQAFAKIDLEKDIQTTQQLYNEIARVRNELGEEIPDDEIDEYIHNFLSGIDSISDKLSKSEIAEAIAKETGESINNVISQIEDFNNSQLAYLQVHLDTGLLTSDLNTWLEENKEYINYEGQVGSQSSFKDILSGYDKENGFGIDASDTIYQNANMSSFMGVSQEQFNTMDQSAQLTEVTKALIENTKYIEENKEAIIEEKEALIEQLEQEQDYIDIVTAGKDIQTKILDNTESYKNSLDSTIPILQKLAKDGYALLSETEQDYIDKLQEESNLTREQLIDYGHEINTAKKYANNIDLLRAEIDQVNNSEQQYAEILENVQSATEATNADLDAIQTNYKNLIDIVEEYNKTGSFNIDQVQQLMTMSDQYVAQLQFEGNQLSLNEQSIQAVTNAKLDELLTENELQYQLKMTELAEIAMAHANDAAAQKEALHAQQLAALGIVAEDTANKLLDVAQAMAAIETGGSAELKAAADQATKAYENRKTAITSAKGQVSKGGSSMKTAMGGGSKSSGGGGSKSEKDLKELDKEFDRYWEIKKAIDAVTKSLEKLDKKQEKLYRNELADSLREENKLLEEQAQRYEALAAEQRKEAGELQGILAGSGVTFDASGAITNYAAATSAALVQYNDAVTKYNAGLLDDSAFEIYEKNYEKFKETLSRYETLVYEEIKETQDKLEEIWRKGLENNLKAWELEVDLKLNLKELKRGWNDFIKDITSDFKKVYKDLRVEVNNLREDAKTFIGADGSIATDIDAVHKVVAEFDKLKAGGTSDMFESISQAQDKLRELNSQLQSDAKDFHDLWQNAWDAYIEGIDQVADHLDDIIQQYEKINDELEFQKDLIGLLYGDEAYDLMSKYYEGQELNSFGQLKSMKTQVDMWHQLWLESGATMANQADWTADQQKYYEQWQAAQSELNDQIVDYIKLLKDDYLNTVSAVLKELETGLTGGSSLKDMATQWERISAHADKYLDDVEGAYEIQSFANKIDESIASTTNLKNQQKLQAFRDKEISYLREKEKLTQYDLDAAEARYQIALKEMALEDAQANKTSMKLTRNEQGNWSYQYIADEQDIASKRQDLLAAYNDLYQLASNAYEANLEALQELQEKYLESAREIYENENLTEEERQQKLLELREYYLEEYKALAEENSLYRDDLVLASQALLLEVYHQDQDAYTAMTETERDLLDALVDAHITSFMDLEEKTKENYKEIGDKAKEVMAETREDWTSGAQLISDLWNKDNGVSVKSQVVNAYNRIIIANTEYQNKVDELARAVDRDFGPQGIVGAIENAENATYALEYATVEMTNTSVAYLVNLKSAVDEIANAWVGVQQQILNAMRLLEQYINDLSSAQAAAQQASINAAAAQAAQAAAISGSGSGSSGGGGYRSGSNNSGSNTVISATAGGMYFTGTRNTDGTIGNVVVHGGASASEARYNTADALRQAQIAYDLSKNKKNKSGTAQYATGGYTGEWDSSGKLAVLHQKELVLNADDTKNFLSGIQMIRDMSSVNGSISNAITKAMQNMALAVANNKREVISGGVTQSSAGDNKVFNITAEFPNANSVDEIREAILSLPNYASQFSNSTRL